MRLERRRRWMGEEGGRVSGVESGEVGVREEVAAVLVMRACAVGERRRVVRASSLACSRTRV